MRIEGQISPRHARRWRVVAGAISAAPKCAGLLWSSEVGPCRANPVRGDANGFILLGRLAVQCSCHVRLRVRTALGLTLLGLDAVANGSVIGATATGISAIVYYRESST